ncbi:hypothetical protein GQ53DRAFT_830052 [Thozetella sp. PMI_491]|nr:hypothetical protein GQ53DRAFT_830052 [Thozetella sp. PMI_491]
MIVKLALVSLASLILPASTLEIGDRFSLFAWEGVPILPVFYRNGTAVVASYATANATDDLIPLTFAVTDPKGSGTYADGFAITAAPNTSAPVQNKATLNPPFSNVTFALPDASSSSRDIKFTSNLGTPGFITKGFRWAGKVLYVYREDKGALVMQWTVFPTDTPGIWSLAWNISSTQVEGVKAVTLRAST